jgi:hypothetical protein
VTLGDVINARARAGARAAERRALVDRLPRDSGPYHVALEQWVIAQADHQAWRGVEERLRR